MRHMLAGENVAMIMPRRVEYVGNWQHVLVSDSISEHVVVSLKTIDYHFPLYIYPDKERHDLFSHHEPSERRSNLNPKVVAALKDAYRKAPVPEALFNYIYAVLYADTYREKYADFLRIDFPRIPFTFDKDIFEELASLGERLVALHLLKSSELDQPIAHFEGEGDNRVAKNKSKGFRYEEDELRVFINKTQYFEPVPPEVWQYQIGGYQVCEKWLKDRKDRRLELEDIRTYCRIVTALAKTIELQKKIDTLYPKVEENLLTITLD